MSHLQSHSILTISLNRGFYFFLENISTQKAETVLSAVTQFIYTHSCSLQMSPTNLRRSAKIFGDLKPWPAQCALRIKDMSGITIATERNSALSSAESSKLFPLVQIVKKTEKFGFTMIYEIKQNFSQYKNFFQNCSSDFLLSVVCKWGLYHTPNSPIFSEAAVNSI